MTSATAARGRGQLLMWEAGCVSGELAGAGLGLWLGLGLDNWAAGGLVLFGVCAVSFVTRLWHYSREAETGDVQG